MSDQKVCPVCQAPVEPGQPTCARCGFKLEGQTEQFHCVDVAANVPAPSADAQAGKSLGTPTFTIVSGAMEGESFMLTTFPLVIGRDPGCELFLNDRTVTRRHASLDVIDNEVVISDLNSLNGIWIDGEMKDSAVLKDGTIVQIGIFNMVFHI